LSTPQRTLITKAFLGGDLMAFLGGCELDLEGCELDPGGATLGIFAWWGGVKVRVPRHWRVEIQVLSLMGASEDKTHQEKGVTGPPLVLQGFVVMGGVEVTS
jgi:hypothetical protein